MSSRADVAVSRATNSSRTVRATTVFASVVVAGTLAAVAASPSAVAATALFVGGIGESMLPDFLMRPALGGKFTGVDPVSQTPWVRQSVYWPALFGPPNGFTPLGASVSAGTTNLIADIAAAQQSGNGPVTVVGASAGSLVLDETMRYYQEHPDQAPAPGTVDFVVIADGSRQDAFRGGTPFATVSGYTFRSPSPTTFDVSVVTYEYDGFADFPDRPMNLLADLNAVAGIFLLHSKTYFADIANMTPTSVVTDPVTNATTTRYLIAPQQLPLVTLIPALAPLQAELKKIIDAGYSRNDTAAAASPLASTPAARRSVTAPPATTSPTVTPTVTPTASRRPQAVVADTTPPPDRVPAVVPKAGKPSVTRTTADEPVKAPKAARLTAAINALVTRALAPKTDPVRGGDRTTGADPGTTHQTRRAARPGNDARRSGADPAATHAAGPSAAGSGQGS